MLVRFSPTVLFSASIFPCMALNRGKPTRTTKSRSSARIGIATASTTARLGLSEIAMISAPMSMPGARRNMRSSMLTKFCICVTSLVRRVTSEPVWNLSMLAKENFCTLRKTSMRRSLAKLTDAFAPK